MIVPYFKLPEQQQYHHISLEDAIRLYEHRLLTAAGFIYTITKIYSANGQKLNIREPREFYEYFNIPKSTFYRALSQLENSPELKFHWERVVGGSIWCGDEAQQVVGCVRTECDDNKLRISP
jgi:hypothetical protein